jgi:hypothetical protein
MSESTINVGDLVTRYYINKDVIGVVTRIKECDNGTDIYDVYYVDWFDNKKRKPHEARQLALYRGHQ